MGLITQRNELRVNFILSYILNPAENSWKVLGRLKKISWGGSGEESNNFNSELHEFQVACDSLEATCWDCF